MNVDEIIDDMYNNMLKRCGISNSAESAVKDNFYDTHKNLLEEPKMSSETNSEQSGYGSGIKFERLRRITGYLVGDTNRWNNAKFAELNDREKHNV